MTIRRSMRCPTCDLAFLVVFDSREHLEERAVRIDCPRVEGGEPCGGFIMTLLPTKYVVRPGQ
jgi:transcriptional regulator NrdR family protein